MTKKVPLRNTPGQFSLVDDDDYARVAGLRWNLARNGYVVSYIKTDDHKRTLFLHRVIMHAPSGLQVDHINRDRTDNRRENLRFATRSQNQANKGVSRNSSTRLKGVTIEGHRYRARIRFDRRKRLHLGLYEDPELAARVYDAASRLLNQEFAGVNFPDETTSPEVEAILRHFIAQCPPALAYLEREGRLEGPLPKGTGAFVLEDSIVSAAPAP